MALYEYKCPVHGEIELSHPISEIITECPLCKEDGVTTPIVRQISKTSFVLKGSGWAKDNYS